MLNPKISVVVPVFNTGKYLPKCLDSLLLQTYDNIEIICVNDGSDDNSLEVLEQYAKKDSRIKVYSQENSGVSVARNLGMSESSGDYVSFIDSDDWVYLTLYQEFVNCLNKLQKNIDIFMFNAAFYSVGKNDAYPKVFVDALDWNNHTSEYTIHTFDDCMRPFSRNLSASNKIYRKQFLVEKDIKFEENLIYEDQYFAIKTFLNANSIVFTDEIFYKYRRGDEVTLSTQSSEKAFNIFEIMDLVDAEINKLDVYESYKYALFQYKTNTFVQRFSYCPEALKNEYYEEMKNRLLIAETQGIDAQIASKLRNYNIFYHIKISNREGFEKYLKKANLNFV